MTFKKQYQTGVRIPYKNINMSIKMSTMRLALTPMSYLNQAFTNIVNPHRQLTIIVNPLR